MALSVNTNIASLNAQRNLTKSGSELNVSLQRLSTGLRINSAKDDAAGLAISERFTTQIRGLNQAARNANDGISLAQTAEGALGGVTDLLQRMRELAVQSANATNSTSDRAALQTEVTQLVAEIDRVADTTSFNSVTLLDGSFNAQAFQVGANANQTVSIASIADANVAVLGQQNGATSSATALAAALTAGDLYINGTDVGTVAQDAVAVANAITANIADVSATATTSTSGALGAFTTTSSGATDTYSLNVGGVSIFNALALNGDTLTAAELDIQLGTTGVVDQLAASGITQTGTAAAGTLEFSRADGANLTITETLGGGPATGGFTTTLAGAADTYYGGVAVTSTNGADLAFSGAAVPAGFANQTAAITAGTSVGFVNISTAAGSQTAIDIIDRALTDINSSRADLGALQNRFEAVITNISITSENLTASRGRIQDADFAAETANLTKTQILQQAGVSILAQANGLPQLALSLLQ